MFKPLVNVIFTAKYLIPLHSTRYFRRRNNYLNQTEAVDGISFQCATLNESYKYKFLLKY